MLMACIFSRMCFSSPGWPSQQAAFETHSAEMATGIVKTLCEGIAKYSPKAWVAIISNPVNSTVPIAAEVFKK